jgi:hypothetical protein
MMAIAIGTVGVGAALGSGKQASLHSGRGTMLDARHCAIICHGSKPRSGESHEPKVGTPGEAGQVRRRAFLGMSAVSKVLGNCENLPSLKGLKLSSNTLLQCKFDVEEGS